MYSLMIARFSFWASVPLYSLNALSTATFSIIGRFVHFSFISSFDKLLNNVVRSGLIDRRPSALRLSRFLKRPGSMLANNSGLISMSFFTTFPEPNMRLPLARLSSIRSLMESISFWLRFLSPGKRLRRSTTFWSWASDRVFIFG